MAAKVQFDHANRLIIPTVSPDGNGRITINVQVDIYSDGKEDWLADSTLNKFRFPVQAIGGNVTALGKLGTTYVLDHGWHIRPFEADHEFLIQGNIVTADGSALLVDTIGSFSVNAAQQLSTLVEVREIYEQALEDIRKVMLNSFKTDPATGQMVVYDDDGATPALTADIWEDVAKTQPYRGRGIERRDAFDDGGDSE